MNAAPAFAPRLLILWIAGAVIAFVIALYFIGGGELGGPDSFGPNTFSRSAIGHAGIAEVLSRIGVPVVKSRSNSLEKLGDGSVLVIAEPSQQAEAAVRPLLKGPTILLVLPKWSGLPSLQNRGWVGQVAELPLGEAQWALGLVAPRGQVMRQTTAVTFTTNSLKITPQIDLPVQLMRADRLRPLISAPEGVLLGEMRDANREVWVLSDPDIISNHGLAHRENAALAVAIAEALRTKEGQVVFDETVHGFVTRPTNALMLLFRFPFVVATLQGVVALVLLFWATLARFGAPRSAPAALSTGREGLLQNMAKLVEFTGHQDVMVRRYVEETVRDAAVTLHAPRELSGKGLTAWLTRVGLARGTTVDFEALLQRAGEGGGGRRSPSALVKLARDIHQWKGEIVDGRARHPGRH
jgi:hypothetical protein